jgi:hypothetical protein
MKDVIGSKTSGGESVVDKFLAKVESGQTSLGSSGRGRLIFGLDATMSRQPTWDAACQLQSEMFKAAAGGLEVQLVYYRGTSECQASRWLSNAAQLSKIMERINCLAGNTKIARVLQHVIRETRTTKVHATIFVGDAMEEIVETLYGLARELGALKSPVFLFQEGYDDEVETTFRKIAKLSGGAYSRFDAGAAVQLAELLRAVAVFASGGVAALADMRGNQSAAKLLSQMR